MAGASGEDGLVEPLQRGHTQGEALVDRGRARRWLAEDGHELWRLANGDTAIMERLVRLGARNVGGFVDGGEDEVGPWLVRRIATSRLADALAERPGPWPWREAISLVSALARGQAAIEAASLFIGALTPDAAAFGDGRTWLTADGYVAALVGAGDTAESPAGTTPLEWMAPECVDDATWYNSSNRYALGVLLYRLLAGEHPFLGRGLRQALSSAREPAVPFEDEIARALPLGLQGFCLRLIAPEAAQRPARAAEIVGELEEFLDSPSFLGAEAPEQASREAPIDAERAAGGGRDDAGRESARAAAGAHDEAPPHGATATAARTTQDTARHVETKAARAPHGKARDAVPKAARDPQRTVRDAESKAATETASDAATEPANAPARGPASDAATEPANAPARGPASDAATEPASAHDARRLERLASAARRHARSTAAMFAAVLAVTGAAWFATRGRDTARRDTPPIASARPLAAGATTSADCATCHAREVAEWRDSVMAHAVKSPLFNALELVVEEQIGRDRDCPNGAGILRRAGGEPCRDSQSGERVSGAGGEQWCVNCHAPGENLERAVPAWNGRGGSQRERLAVIDSIAPASREGISCAFCHQVHGPAGPTGSAGYVGNDTWVSFTSGARFSFRPEDGTGRFGIGNSGYRLVPSELLLQSNGNDGAALPGGMAVHARPSEAARRHLRSSEMCGACHDVRLFGTDTIGSAAGEHFKRLRNAYSEWRSWAEGEERLGRKAATCQDCHMSSYPGVCVAGTRGEQDKEGLCPDGMRFSPRAPGERPLGFVAPSSAKKTPIAPHYFAAVDFPMSSDFDEGALDRPGTDEAGAPLAARARRKILLARGLSLSLGEARRARGRLAVPVVVENIGAGHRIPAGFSQERELWVHLTIRDARGGLVYEVGRVDRDDEDLHDKVFADISTDPERVDEQGRPLGLFGADVRDGPDVPLWEPPPALGGTRFRGRGLINFQNGFLRCVRCLGEVGPRGECLPVPGERHRAERYVDGDYDLDTGECRSNLAGTNALFETYFPVGALDRDRGVPKAPDAIIDTRSLAPNVPVEYVYDIDTRGRPAPFSVEARLVFRAFPPYLVRAFAEYEARQAALGRRPRGPHVTNAMLRRLERVELASREVIVP